jgi:hypothetical protein
VSLARLAAFRGSWPVRAVGRRRSAILGLDLGLEADRFRFYAGSAVLPDAVELIERANRVADELQSKFDTLEQAFAHEQQRAEHEQQRRALAEARIRELEAEVERLTRG